MNFFCDQHKNLYIHTFESMMCRQQKAEKTTAKIKNKEIKNE